MNPLIERYVVSHAEYNQCYRDISNEIKAKRDEIDRLTNQINKLKKKKMNIPAPMVWMDVLDGYKNELESMSGLVFERRGPFGLRAEVRLCLVDKSKKDTMGLDKLVYSLIITPNIIYSDEGKIVGLNFSYDTGEVDRSYPEGSIGALNHCGNHTEELPDDAAAIYELMKTYANKRNEQ